MPEPLALSISAAAALTAAILAASVCAAAPAIAHPAPAVAPTVASTALTQSQQRQQIATLFNTINATRTENGFKALKFGVAATARAAGFCGPPRAGSLRAGFAGIQQTHPRA